jgi:hypothetical protein
MTIKEYAKEKIKPGRTAATLTSLVQMPFLGAEKGKRAKVTRNWLIGAFPAAVIGASVTQNPKLRPWSILLGTTLGGTLGTYLGYPK